MHCKCKYFGRKVEFNRVVRPLSHDPHQFLANKDGRSKLRQYNIDTIYKDKALTNTL